MLSLPERSANQAALLGALKDNLQSAMRVALPGIVESFDPVEQTVTVKPAVKERISINGTAEDAELPLLLDVPIVMPRAGGFSLTMPVTAGDECLVIFSDICIDFWWLSGGIQPQAERRRHDLSDAVAIIGCWSQPRRVPNYHTSGAQLKSETGRSSILMLPDSIDISSGEIRITADSITQHAADIDINAGGNTVIEGRNFTQHQHTGVMPGGSNTGGVA